MRDALAERLLARVMEWKPEDVARERPVLEFLAAYKYDEYQQFSPGMRFIESLALWLNQFKTQEERVAAYNFMRQRLVFVSSSELNALVASVYPDFIRPKLVASIAYEEGISIYQVRRIAKSKAFEVLLRRSLFLGLSDGGRTDVFRRSNPNISHEQVFSYYDVSLERLQDSRLELKSSLKSILGRDPVDEELTFRHVFLMDDFSGSGSSFLRWKEEKGKFTGKIAKFFERVVDVPNSIVDSSATIHIVLYVATLQAQEEIEKQMCQFFKDKSVRYSLIIVHSLSEDLPITKEDVEFFELITDQNYYDKNVEDKHTEVGGGSVQRGFGQCSLPLVLSHNTPNNSVFLLWSDRTAYSTTGLFPRVSRHRKEI